MNNLMNKGHKTVDTYMNRNGYQFVWADELDNGNTVVEFSKTHAGVTLKSIIITFSPAMRVINVKED